jgi:prophage antirepressor-like protein
MVMKHFDFWFDKNNVRSFVDEDGVVWFHGTQICNILGYKNPSDAIPYNVDEADRMKVDIGELNEVWFINEAGLYDLIIACKKAVAKPFHKWLSHEVLPSIRKDGFFVEKDSNSVNAEKLQEELDRVNAEKNQMSIVLRSDSRSAYWLVRHYCKTEDQCRIVMDIINFNCFGFLSKEIRQKYGIPYPDPIRDHFHPLALERVDLAQRLIHDAMLENNIDIYMACSVLDNNFQKFINPITGEYYLGNCVEGEGWEHLDDVA